jgi:hypothetical protein
MLAKLDATLDAGLTAAQRALGSDVFWTTVNVPWLDSFIRAGATFIVGEGATFTAREIAYLTAAGYTWLGDALLIAPIR